VIAALVQKSPYAAGGLRDACRSGWQNDVEPVEYCQPPINFCQWN